MKVDARVCLVVALLAYVVRGVFSAVPKAFAGVVTAGIPHAFGPAALPLFQWAAATAFLIVILVYRRAAKK